VIERQSSWLPVPDMIREVLKWVVSTAGIGILGTVFVPSYRPVSFAALCASLFGIFLIAKNWNDIRLRHLVSASLLILGGLLWLILGTFVAFRGMLYFL
jgi:hypothetical protein